MTKADIVDIIASATGLTKVETEAVVDGFISTVINALKEGKNIEIRGFGTFKVKLRKARKARNPRTGDEVPVPDRKVPVFKPSNEFKNVIITLTDQMKDHPEVLKMVETFKSKFPEPAPAPLVEPAVPSPKGGAPVPKK